MVILVLVSSLQKPNNSTITMKLINVQKYHSIATLTFFHFLKRRLPHETSTPMGHLNQHWPHWL